MFRTRTVLVALVAATLLITPIAAHAQEAAPAAPCLSWLPGPAGAVVMGRDRQQSAPFALEGGAYMVTWDATDTTALSFIDMEPADERTAVRPVLILAPSDAAPGRSGQTHIYNVKPGTYYLSASLSGPWSVRFTPIPV